MGSAGGGAFFGESMLLALRRADVDRDSNGRDEDKAPGTRVNMVDVKSCPDLEATVDEKTTFSVSGRAKGS